MVRILDKVEPYSVFLQVDSCNSFRACFEKFSQGGTNDSNQWRSREVVIDLKRSSHTEKLRWCKFKMHYPTN